LRAFVALEISGSVVDSLVGFQKELEATGADVKLVERWNLHLNLKFLGEVSEAQAAEVKSRLGGLEVRAAQVEIRGVGAFPSPNRPRVIWAGVAREYEGLVTPIAQRVVGALDGIGERDDRPFRAHITLGRIRSPRNVRELTDLLRDNSERPFGITTLSEVKFKSSLLTPRGPVYKDIGVYRLS
jgi:2'-5' RNA ligase